MKKIIALALTAAVVFACNDSEPSSRIDSNGEKSSKHSGKKESSNRSNSIKSDYSEYISSSNIDASVPIFQFEKETHNFGTLTEGEVGMTVFRFTNTGSVPLIISAAQGSCGCTVPTWPEAPIAPGAEGEIEVRFNSENRVGSIDKTVTLTANTVPNTKVLRITGQVVKP